MNIYSVRESNVCSDAQYCRILFLEGLHQETAHAKTSERACSINRKKYFNIRGMVRNKNAYDFRFALTTTE